MTPTTGAQPMPENGQRSLSPSAAQARQKALACLRAKSSECQGQLHVNIFFDGTGNNRDWNGVFVNNPPKTRSLHTQLVRNGHSNVARLYDASHHEPENGLFSIYIPGVGTPFPDVNDNSQEGSSLGAGAALYGADRIHWAILQIMNAVHQYLTRAPLLDRATTTRLANEMSTTQLVLENYMRGIAMDAVARRLENVVKNHQRKVRSLKVSVFGFSRGAAQARAFAHRLFDVAKAWGSGCGHNIGGVPMTLNFMGIFDTVASVGVAGISRVVDGKMDWAKGEMMSIHPEVRQCVHFAALHEQRINFPLDLAASGKEVLYPGMHSDVGGGYSPGSQGKDGADGSTKLAQIPLIDMHYEALKAGVTIRTLEELKPLGALATHFSCNPQLIRDYNAWLTGHGLAGGPHAGQIRAHCQQYVLWKGKRLWEGESSVVNQPFFQRSDSEDQYDLRNAQRDFGNLVARYSRGKSDSIRHQQQLNEIRTRVLSDRSAGRPASHMNVPRGTPAAYEYQRLNADTKSLLDGIINKGSLPDVSTTLFDNYVHDSLAGFYIVGGYTELNIPALSTNGYLRYRDVFSIASSVQPRVCIDPRTTTLPPANPPSVDQLFSNMGRAMGGF